MRTTTANFDTYNSADSKKPSAFVDFVDAVGVDVYERLSTHDTSGLVTDSSHTYVACLIDFEFEIPRLDALEPHVEGGSYRITIADKSGAFTNIMNTRKLINGNVSIYIGYEPLAEADYVPLLSARIISIALQGDLLTWVISARDHLSQVAGVKVATLPKTISTSVLFTSTFTGHVTCETNVINFIDSTVAGLPSYIHTLGKIDEELFKYTAVGPSRLDGTLVRGFGGTVAADHSTGSEIQQALGFACDPMTVLLHILTTSKFGLNGPYDLGLSNFGLGIPSVNVAIEQIERLGYKLFDENEFEANDCYVCMFGDHSDALEYIEANLLRPFGCFLLANGRLITSRYEFQAENEFTVGHIDWVDWNENFADQNVLTLTTSNSDTPRKLEIQTDYLRNLFSIRYGLNKVTDEARVTVNVELSASTAIYETPLEPFEITFPGFVEGQDTNLRNHFLRRFMPFLDPPSIFEVRTRWQYAILEIGDKLYCTSSFVPHIANNARGWTSEKCLLIGLSMSYRSGEVLLTLMNFTAHGKVLMSGTNNTSYAINKVAEGSITDKTLAVNATVGATTQADDAYYDNSVTLYAAHRIIFFIRITPPGSALTTPPTSETISLTVMALSSVPAILHSNAKRFIRYYAHESTAFVVEIDLYMLSATPITPNRIKVDWESVTGAPADNPTVEFVGAWFVDYDFDY